MKHSPRDSKPAKLSESLTRLLQSYTLAASAAGVCMVALAPPSEAKIIYTKTHQVIGWNGIYALDVNGDGEFDFIISQWYSYSYPFGIDRFGFAAQPAISNAIVGTSGQYQTRFAAALKRGARIGKSQHFLTTSGFPAANLVSVSVRSSTTRGQWKNVSNRYLGLKFQIDGKVHYGWARLSVQLGDQFSATLTGFAYETVANRPILAGHTHGSNEASTEPSSMELTLPNAVIPSASNPQEPGSLGNLALGAQGRLARRQR
jgi:hypothetical protein